MRASWDEYFMGSRIRRQRARPARASNVGAVIVRDRHRAVTATTARSRAAHCEDAECIMEDGHCITT